MSNQSLNDCDHRKISVLKKYNKEKKDFANMGIEPTAVLVNHCPSTC